MNPMPTTDAGAGTPLQVVFFRNARGISDLLDLGGMISPPGKHICRPLDQLLSLCCLVY